MRVRASVCAPRCCAKKAEVASEIASCPALGEFFSGAASARFCSPWPLQVAMCAVHRMIVCVGRDFSSVGPCLGPPSRCHSAPFLVSLRCAPRRPCLGLPSLCPSATLSRPAFAVPLGCLVLVSLRCAPRRTCLGPHSRCHSAPLSWLAFAVPLGDGVLARLRGATRRPCLD